MPQTIGDRSDVGVGGKELCGVGASSTSYSPGESVTREQMAAFLERLYNTVTS